MLSDCKSSWLKYLLRWRWSFHFFQRFIVDTKNRFQVSGGPVQVKAKVTASTLKRRDDRITWIKNITLTLWREAQCLHHLEKQTQYKSLSFFLSSPFPSPTPLNTPASRFPQPTQTFSKTPMAMEANIWHVFGPRGRSCCPNSTRNGQPWWWWCGAEDNANPDDDAYEILLTSRKSHSGLHH